MDVAAADSHLCEVLLQLFSHSFGEGGDKHSFVSLLPYTDLFQKVVYLIFHRSYLYRRVKEAGRADNLFHHQSFRSVQFVFCRGGADEDFLSGDCLELLEFQRSVVGCGRKSESVVHKHGLTGMVTSVHSPDLRQRHVTLIDECDEVLREVIDKAEWSHTLASPVEIA